MNATDSLWSEFQACMKMGLDIDVYFLKNRASRMMITGGSIADGAINAMRSFDIAKERKMKADSGRKGKRK